MDFLERISDTIWEIPISYKEGMRVSARIYGSQQLIREMDAARRTIAKRYGSKRYLPLFHHFRQRKDVEECEGAIRKTG